MNKLHFRIMLPFITLFLVVTVMSIMLDRHYIGRLLDDRITRQSERVSYVLSNAQFVLNPVYIEKLRNVIEGDIIVFNQDGTIAATTLPEAVIQHFRAIVNPEGFFRTLDHNKQRMISNKVMEGPAAPFMMTARLLSDPAAPDGERLLCLIFPLSDILNAEFDITIWMFWVGFSGLFLTIFFGFLISKSITKPIKELVAVTGNIAKGDFSEKANLPRVVEIKLLALAINAMTEKLMNYEKQLVLSTHLAAAGKISAAMAHEIRNPLSSIKMMTQLLRNRPAAEPDTNTIIKSLMEEIDRLERIVSDLTNLMKPSELAMNLHDVNESIREIIPVIEPKLTHLKINLATELDTSLPTCGMDKDKIKQVIWNLLLNAMESMPGGGVITVRTNLIGGNTKEANHALLITIEDEGHGIAKDDLGAIFEYFQTTKPEGLGLGLSISKEIIERHGGHLEIDNRPIRGVRASIYLPVIGKG